MKHSSNLLETIYDKYGSILYGIASEVSNNEMEASKIVAITFKKAYTSNELLQTQCLCSYLFRLLITTACQEFKTKQIGDEFAMNFFSKTPLLYKLLCGHESIAQHCNKHEVTIVEAGKQLRKEFQVIRSFKD